MGTQVNFYMTPADEQDFVAYVRSDRNVGIFKSVIPSSEIPLLQVLPPQGEPYWFALCLWDMDHSPRPVVTFIKQQGHYCVEEIESEVIQFHRCGLDDGRLVRGRIWAEMTGWRHDDPSVLVTKGEPFRKWFDRLANWIKRRSTRDARGDYLLPGAAEFLNRGGQLCQAVLAGGRAL